MSICGLPAGLKAAYLVAHIIVRIIVMRREPQSPNRRQDLPYQGLVNFRSASEMFPAPVRGLKGCSLAFYRADTLGDDSVWDNWRLEGPAFVWHYRGPPHVHVWVNVADDSGVEANAKNLSGPLRQKES